MTAAEKAAGLRYLIVTSDDLGLCADVNAATFDAVERGIVRSVEIMALAPAFGEAAAFLRDRPEIDVGVHLMLTSEFTGLPWRPLLSRADAPSLYDDRGFCPEDVDTLRRRLRVDDAKRELEAQVLAVIDAGLQPTHFSQHMFALDELSDGGDEAAEVLAHLADRFRLGMRVTNPRIVARLESLERKGVPIVSRVAVDTHDVAASAKPEHYARIVRSAVPGAVTELIVHCAFDTDAMRAFTTFGPRRQHDYDLVTDGVLGDLIAREGVTLVSWKQVPRLTP